MLTDPRLMDRHEWLMQIDRIERDVIAYGQAQLTDAAQIKPRMYLQSSQGYFYVRNVCLQTGRVTLERCHMNEQAMLERTGRYVPKKATVLNVNYGWSVATAKPAPGGSWWDEYAETVSLVVVTLVSCLVVMLIVSAIDRFVL